MNYRYIEETVLTVFLWIGLWGSISLLLEHLTVSWWSSLFIYFFITFVSFVLLHAREHIPNT
jgi:hypothetical protein